MAEEYDKLVRDRIPEIIRENGEEPEIERLEDDEIEAYVLEKVVEEARELRESGEKEELADLLEVVEKMMEIEEWSEEELEKLREEKNRERGGFDENIVLKSVRE